MPTKDEIDRLAKSINVLRPEWPIPSLVTYIARSHTNRPYQDLAIALTAVAVDPRSQTPKRVEEAGPWWKAAQTVFAATTAPQVGPGRDRCTVYGHESYPARTCPGCRTEHLTTGTWPTGTRHQEAGHTPTEPDYKTRAAGDYGDDR